MDLYGSERNLADGTTVTADQVYLREAVVDPQAKIVEGYENVVMPPTGASLTAQEIEAVLAYIASLSEGAR